MFQPQRPSRLRVLVELETATPYNDVHAFRDGSIPVPHRGAAGNKDSVIRVTSKSFAASGAAEKSAYIT